LASREAILQEITQALSAHATASAASLSVTVAPSIKGEGGQALAQRVGRATAAKLKAGGGS